VHFALVTVDVGANLAVRINDNSRNLEPVGLATPDCFRYGFNRQRSRGIGFTADDANLKSVQYPKIAPFF
jgi:hypothetical protein